MVVTAHDAYSFLFSWELMSVSSFVLILFDAQSKQVRKAALSYLVMMHVGFISSLWLSLFCGHRRAALHWIHWESYFAFQ